MNIVKYVERLIYFFIIGLFILPILYGQTLFASSVVHYQEIGYDISYPQCGKPYPDAPAFGVVGVNRGKAFTQNPCFIDEYIWAKSANSPPSVYMNLNYISVTTQGYAMLGPKNCSIVDEVCQAYNYGYQAANYAHEYALSSGAKTKNWWLDIETMNTWSPNVFLNEQVIQGALDFLALQDLNVGIYSTKYQWNIIAGGFKPNLPAWVPGAKDKQGAQKRCNPEYSFTAGPVHMTQWIENNFDNNYLCK